MQVTYLCAVYSIVKVREGEVFFPHLVGNENEQKLTPFWKIVQKITEIADLQIYSVVWDNKKSTLDGC